MGAGGVQVRGSKVGISAPSLETTLSISFLVSAFILSPSCGGRLGAGVPARYFPSLGTHLTSLG